MNEANIAQTKLCKDLDEQNFEKASKIIELDHKVGTMEDIE